MTESTSAKTGDNLNYAGLFRRLFAIFYDSFLLIAILFIVSAIATALNQGKAIEPDDTFYPLFVLIIFFLSYLYFAWFWTHGGQSLGMKTWRIKLISAEVSASETTSTGNTNIGWKTAAIRFISAIFSWAFFGLGFLWALFDKKNRCWHDLISKTLLIDLRS